MSRQQVLVNPKLFDILRPPFKLLRILGLCPATYHQHKNSYIIKWSQNTYIVNVTVTIILGTSTPIVATPWQLFSASWSIWGFVNDMQMASFGALGFTRKIDFVIASFDVSEVIFSALVFVTSTPFKLQHVLDAVDNLNQVDAAIEPILDEEIQKLCKFFQRFLLVFFPTICVIDLYMWGNNSWSGVNNYFAFYILYFIVVVHELQYWHFVTMTRVRLLAINQFVNRNLTKGTSSDTFFFFSCVVCRSTLGPSFRHYTKLSARNRSNSKNQQMFRYWCCNDHFELLPSLGNLPLSTLCDSDEQRNTNLKLCLFNMDLFAHL